MFSEHNIEEEETIVEGLKVSGGKKTTGLEVEWYVKKHPKQKLGEHISLYKDGITFGEQAAKMLSYKKPKKTGVAELKGKKVIVFSGKAADLKMNSKGTCYKYNTSKTAAWLREKGCKRGLYKLREANGGWVAVPIGEDD